MTNLRSDPQARQGRLVALVIAATGVLWVGAQFLWTLEVVPTRLHLLVDLAALGAFIWALITSYGIWRARQRSED